MKGNSKYGVEVDVESVGEGSEVEFNTAAAIGTAHGGATPMPAHTWDGEGIQVKTDVDLKIERVRKEIEIESARSQSRMAR